MPLSAQHLILSQLSSINEAMCEELSADNKSLLAQAFDLEKWPIAQLISTFERNNTQSLIQRHQISAYLQDHHTEDSKNAIVFGITGTPGAGKSSLIGELCLSLIDTHPELSIAILAIDPSSQESGGALLGDRTRTIFPVNDKRIFFRSQASHQDLGGMGKSTFHVTRLLRKLFDIILIETVGIGQSEIEVQRLADHTILVMQPLAGDQIQFMKAGIMEVPVTFIINKCDEEPLAKKSMHLLRSSLKLANIYIDNKETRPKDIFMTSATKHKGITSVCEHILNIRQNTDMTESLKQQEHYFLQKWIRQGYGEFGLGIYHHFKDRDNLRDGTFEERELAFKALIANFLTQLN